MKLQIRSSSLHYAKKKKLKMKTQETSLDVDILALQKKLEETEKADILNELFVKILQKEEISKLKIQASLYQSRWYKEGEKNTKYFLNLEKRHFNKKKTIKSFQLADNSVIKTVSEILKEAESFYQQLYSSVREHFLSRRKHGFLERRVLLLIKRLKLCICKRTSRSYTKKRINHPFTKKGTNRRIS